MDRLDAMRVFLAVVDAGSLSAASRKLRTPLPSVSRKMAELERFLGTNLLIRTSRSIQLTDAGRDYLEAARRILADLEEAERRASGEYQTPRGELTVTMPVEFGTRYVMPLAMGFIEEHAEVTLKLVASDRVVHLVDEQVDVAIRLGQLADSALYAVKVGEFSLLTCATPAYLARHGTPAHPTELQGHDGILFEQGAKFWSFPVEGERLLSSPRARVTVNSAAANLAGARAGVGIARLFDYQLKDDIRSGALVPILTEFDDPPLPVHIVYQRQGLLPLKVRAFVDWMTPRLRAACTSFNCP
jgi:DNA-binding transcriptional LysR family regulator